MESDWDVCASLPLLVTPLPLLVAPLPLLVLRHCLSWFRAAVSPGFTLLPLLVALHHKGLATSHTLNTSEAVVTGNQDRMRHASAVNSKVVPLMLKKRDLS